MGSLAWHNESWQEWPESPSNAHEGGSSPPEHQETVHHLHQEQEEAERKFYELQALTAESERTLAEARRAVTMAARDRGWNQPPQQRQLRPTSMRPKGRGKGHGGKPYGHPGKGKMFLNEDAYWMKGKPSSPHGKAKGKFGFNSKGKDLHCQFPEFVSHLPAEHNQEDLGPSESIVDTGATASAGGHWAVQELCRAVMSARPDSSLQVYKSERPRFRFGNGRWAQALFKVVITCQDTNIALFSLPFPRCSRFDWYERTCATRCNPWLSNR